MPTTLDFSPDFRLYPKQKALLRLIAGPADYVLAWGSSRASKTFAILYYMMQVCLNAPGTRMACFRDTAIACKTSLFNQSAKIVFDAAMPGFWEQCTSNKSDMTIEFPNGSVIMFGGLNDSERVERILGLELHTVLLNEANNISFENFSLIITRLNGKAVTANGKAIPQKILLDCNPTNKRHWLYKLFLQRVNPSSGKPVPNADRIAEMRMETSDNHSIDASYTARMTGVVHVAHERRFEHGDWTDAVDNALFPEEVVNNNRVDPNWVFTPELFARIVVAIDPAAKANEGSDESGIVVVGLDQQGEAYVLADLSCKAAPEDICRIAAEAYHQWGASAVLAEVNNGGAWIGTTLKLVDRSVNYKEVWAKTGKEARAERIQGHYAKGLVHHPADGLKELEDQLFRMNLSYNRARDGSPDRLDALVWALTELFLIKDDTRTGGFTPMSAGIFGR